MKATNPLLLTHLRNQQASTMIADLPIMQSSILPKLLQFNWCVAMDFSGPGKVADAVHPSQFLPRAANGNIGTFKTIEDFRMWVDNIEAVCTAAAFLEDRHSTPFFRRIWLPLREQFRDTSAFGTVEHINKNFMAHELALICNKWAELHTCKAKISPSRNFWPRTSKCCSSTKRSGGVTAAKDAQAPAPAPAAPPRVSAQRQQKRKGAANNHVPQPQAKRQRVTPPVANNGATPCAGNSAPNPAQAARHQDSICLKHTLHAKDPVQFPIDCTQPPPCSRRHNVQLNAEKFSA